MAKHGLTVDNLLSVELVTADGAVLTVSEDEHADLFWALRGGGGNFGVVTSFEYQLHPIGPTVIGGTIVYPFEAAADVLRFYRDICPTFPDELIGYPALVHSPDGSGTKLAGVMVGHVGSHEQAEKDLAPLVSYGDPLAVLVGPIAYSTLNTLIDDACPRGALYYWKSSFLSELSDDAIDTLVERFALCPPPMSLIVLEDVHGEATRVPVDATAVPHRRQGFNLGIYGTWREPERTDEHVAWTRESYAAMRPFLSGTPLCQLPRRRRDRRRADSGRVWPELRPSRRGEEQVRPGQRLPPQPEHPAAVAPEADGRYTMKIALAVLFVGVAMLAGSATASQQRGVDPPDITFASGPDWFVLPADRSALRRGPTSGVGPAQLVCINEFAPPGCPPGATLWGSSGFAWGVDLSPIPDANWVWAPGFTAMTLVPIWRASSSPGMSTCPTGLLPRRCSLPPTTLPPCT